MNPNAVRERVESQLKAQPFVSATVKQDVEFPAVSYLAEHADDFPGVEPEAVFLREYPHHEIGAHLFGTVGEVTKEQLDDSRYRGVSLGDRVGQSGVEYSYDRFLRGENGKKRVQVDALGVKTRDLRETESRQGRNLRLGIDLDVQEVGQAGARHLARRVRRDEREDGRDRRARLVAVVRPEHLRQDHPPARLHAALLRGERQAALQPRDPGRLPDGLDLQARDLGGRARGRDHHARHAALRRRLAGGGRRHVQQRRRRRARKPARCAGADRLERRLLLPARPRGQQQGRRPADPGLGAAARDRPPDRASTCRPRARASSRRRRGATSSTRRS